MFRCPWIRNNFLACIFLSFTIIFAYYLVISHYTPFPSLTPQRSLEPGNMCQCLQSISAPRAAATLNSEGLCQSTTTYRGSDQKVVSYSLAGDIQNHTIVRRYFLNLDKIAQQIADVYPGWIMRIYHNFQATDPALHKYLCWTYCRYSHVDLCNVTDLEFRSPSLVTNNVSKMDDPMWRFLPMADPTVAVFASRDIDSFVTTREAAAVEDWLTTSNATLHILRDHPGHKRPILAGMWGARRDSKRAEDLRNCFIAMKSDSFNFKKKYSLDENMLRKWLQPTIGVADAVRYDSYHCTEYWNQTRPFPTKREGFKFIGLPLHWESRTLPKCPVGCRPPEHQDWEYC